MDLASFYSAIVSRAQADTGTGGLFETGNVLINGWYFNRIPSATNYPYVVAVLNTAQANNAFSVDVVPVTVRFSIWHETVSQTDTDTLNTVSKIQKRIYGPGGAAPSYGFHKHPLSVSGGWTSSPMEFRGITDESDGDLYHFVPEFYCILRR